MFRTVWKSLCLLGFLSGAGAATAADDPDVTIEKGIAYLGTDRKEQADLYRPTTLQPDVKYPGIVIIHGGGWSGGKRDAAREINIGTTLVKNGYVGLSIDYVLQEKGAARIWPQNLNDCKTAVRWLRANAAKYQIDADHIGVIGGSAGGHLAAMVGVTGNSADLPPVGPYGEFSSKVQAAIDLYGPLADREKWIPTLVDPSNPHAAELTKQITPLSHLDKADPPILILHGTADTTVPVDDSERFAAALTTAGVVNELIIIPDAPHTFHLQPKQRDLRPVVLGFFDKYLKPGR
ncbi:MAG TPA: alpha/beta hydrolase [Caulifigura sp.]|nr:alpha/beta hydrolase [Caulifigura sp.]